MATKPTTEQFEFLNPLDGKTYTLPPFDPSKAVKIDELWEAQKDQRDPKPRRVEFFAMSPKDREAIVQAELGEFAMTSVQARMSTLLAHDLGDDVLDVLDSLIVAQEWGVIHKIYNDWAGVEPSEVGEG